ncbi:MAG: hypothetical protein HQM12_04365 [SAR324 cluster bacterium]|nr:hypothetical protein [SAR324 cluster bacterium]
MHRHAVIAQKSQQYVHKMLSDDESLLIQLCEHLFLCGFLYDDSSDNEIHEGELILEDFFRQAPDVFTRWASQEKLHQFQNYIQGFNWTQEHLKYRLHQKTLKAFDQLSTGHSHSYNILHGVMNGLKNFDRHPLQQFMLCLETWYQLLIQSAQPDVLAEMEAPSSAEKTFTAEDILKLRQNIVSRMEQHKFVETLLSSITKKGTVPKKMVYQHAPQYRVAIEFFRPSMTFGNNVKSQGSPVRSTTSASPSAHQTPVTKTLGSHQKIETEAEKKQTETILASKTIKPETKSLPPPQEEYFPDEDEVPDERSSNAVNSESSVIYGTGKISMDAIYEFVMENPDSAIKFIFHKTLDGKPLDQGHLKIYGKWDSRGMRKASVRKCLLELMEWENFPEIPLFDLLEQIKDKIYDIKHQRWSSDNG